MCKFCDSGNLSTFAALDVHKTELSACEVFIKSIADIEDFDYEDNEDANMAVRMDNLEGDILDDELLKHISQDLDYVFKDLFSEINGFTVKTETYYK